MESNQLAGMMEDRFAKRMGDLVADAEKRAVIAEVQLQVVSQELLETQKRLREYEIEEKDEPESEE